MWCETTGSTQGRVPKDCGFLKYIMVFFYEYFVLFFLFCCYIQPFLHRSFFYARGCKIWKCAQCKKAFCHGFCKNCYFLSTFHNFIKITFIKPFSFHFFCRDRNSYFPKGRLLKCHCIEFSHFLLGGVDKFSGNDNLSQ